MVSSFYRTGCAAFQTEEEHLVRAATLTMLLRVLGLARAKAAMKPEDVVVFTELRNLQHADRAAVNHALKELVIELERKRIRDRYPLIVLYRDWLSHSEINRSAAGLEILRMLHEFPQR